MSVENAKSLNTATLKFLRWLALHDMLEHPVAGRPEGEVAMALTAAEGRGALVPRSQTQIRQDLLIKQSLRDYVSRNGDY